MHKISFLESPQILIKEFFELVVDRDFPFLAAFFPEPDVREPSAHAPIKSY